MRQIRRTPEAIAPPAKSRAADSKAVAGRTLQGHHQPLLLLNRQGDCLAAKLRAGRRRSSDAWDGVLRADAAYWKAGDL